MEIAELLGVVSTTRLHQYGDLSESDSVDGESFGIEVFGTVGLTPAAFNDVPG